MRPFLALLLALTLAAPAAAQDAYGRGLVVPADLAQRAKLSHARKIASAVAPAPPAAETEWDSRAKGWVPPVRDQGGCGSCWDFAAVRSAEIAAVKAGKAAATADWSEQTVLSCGRNGGCSGDWPETALEQIRSSGIAHEADMPYQARATACNASVPRPNTIDDYGYVGSDSGVPPVQAIKDAIKAYGSVAVAVAADNAFANYRSGVFQGSGSRGINHAVVLVGWNDAGGYWILSNSWGAGWGEQGYMRIKYGANLVGYGAMYAVVAGSPAPTPPVPPDPIPPGPAPTPGKGFTGTIATVQQYKDGAKVGEPLTIVGSAPNGEYDGGDLRAAGVNPALIGDVLELLRSVRARDRAAILAAVTKLLADLALMEPAPQPAPPPTPVPEPMPALRPKLPPLPDLPPLKV